MSHVDVQRVFPGRGLNRRVRRGVSAAAREYDIGRAAWYIIDKTERATRSLGQNQRSDDGDCHGGSTFNALGISHPAHREFGISHLPYRVGARARGSLCVREAVRQE